MAATSSCRGVLGIKIGCAAAHRSILGNSAVVQKTLNRPVSSRDRICYSRFRFCAVHIRTIDQALGVACMLVVDGRIRSVYSSTLYIGRSPSLVGTPSSALPVGDRLQISGCILTPMQFLHTDDHGIATQPTKRMGNGHDITAAATRELRVDGVTCLPPLP